MFDYVKIKSLFHLFSGYEITEDCDNVAWHYVNRAVQNIHNRMKDEDFESEVSISYYVAAYASYDYLIDYMRDLKKIDGRFGKREDMALSLARRLVEAYEDRCSNMLTERLYEA